MICKGCNNVILEHEIYTHFFYCGKCKKDFFFEDADLKDDISSRLDELEKKVDNITHYVQSLADIVFGRE